MFWKKPVAQQSKPYICGTAELVAGEAVVYCEDLAHDSLVFLSVVDARGTQGFLSARVFHASFDISSTSSSDHSIVAWAVLK